MSNLRLRAWSIAIVIIAALVSLNASGLRSEAQSSPELRAARVEQGLCPGIVIAGRPLPAKSLTERMAELKIPGASVAVINDGAVEWAKGYGAIETGASTAVTPRTLFQAASMSKPVAALAALLLVEQGKLFLDEDVNMRLKSWKVPDSEFTKIEKVTLRRLLSHTAGLTVHGFGGYPAEAAVPSVVQVLDGQKPANSEAVRAEAVPGSRMSYSGGGFTVIQQLVIDVTGKSFPALLSELVLKPMGMTDSTYEQPLPSARRSDAASGHLSDGRLLPGRFHTYPEMAAAGLWTTPTDLARFLIEIQRALQGRSSILSKETARLMTTEVTDGYGLGLSLQGTGPSATFGHGGSNEGFKCSMAAFIESGRGVVIMTNGDRGGWLGADIRRTVAREYGWPAFQPREKTVVRVDPAVLASYVGRYELRPGKIIAVALEGNKLFAIDGQEKIELYAESENRFFELAEENDIEFLRGADGKASHMVFNGGLKALRVGN